MIEMTNVVAKYKNGNFALDDVSFKINPGEFVYIIGATGSGKTSLIRILNGELKPQKGKVKVGNIAVNRIHPRHLPYYRRHVGVIFQDFKLLPLKRVYENVDLVAACIGQSQKESRPRLKACLQMVGLWDKRNAFPPELSGGQQQSVAIARAMMNKPQVILADEPTGNLDPSSSERILKLLHFVNRDEKATVVMVTHNIQLIKKVPSRVIMIDKGKIVKDIPKHLSFDFLNNLS